MNLPILWRVIWKEYRLQRSLWLTMAALAVFVQLLAMCLDLTPFQKMIVLQYAAMVTPALYVLGCGATLFAGEHEAETYEFQRSLPVRAISLLVGKVIFVIISALVLLVFLSSLASLLFPLPSLPKGHPAPWRILIWTTIGFFSVEVFLWAVFFSLWTKRVLIAAVLGVAAASTTVHIAAATITWNIVLETYRDAMPWRLAIAAVVALADIWLASRWFREKRQWHLRFAGTAAPSDFLHNPRRLTVLRRLVWQHWRQSRGMMLGVCALFLPAAMVLVVSLISLICLQTDRVQQSTVLLAIVVTLPAAPLFGVCAFLADQRRNGYRFLTDRGVAPKFVWLSRQLIALGLPLLVLSLLCCGLFILALLIVPNHLPSSALPHNSESYLNLRANIDAFFFLLFRVLGYVILGFTVGQLCSMFFRSPLLAGLFSLLLTAILVGWCLLMWSWQISWLWSILPIPIALLLATWLRVGDWLLERNSLRAWLRPGLALLVPTVALLVAVPMHRIHEIPLVDPGFSLDEFAISISRSAPARGDLYSQAISNLRVADDKAVELAIKANKEKLDFRLRLNSDFTPARDDLHRLADLLIDRATKSEKKGQLDAALERYLAAIRISVHLREWYPMPISWHDRNINEGQATQIEMAVYARLPAWAAHKGQTPERILAASQQLEQLTANVFPSTSVKLTYFRFRCFLSGDASAAFDPGEVVNVPLLTQLWFHLPWERARAVRLLNRLTRDQLDKLSVIEKIVSQNGGGILHMQKSPMHFYLTQMHSDYALRNAIYIPPVEYDGSVEQIVKKYAAMVTARRAVRTVLALEAWKLKNGSLPTKLDELVGHGLDRVPVDPYSGEPFRYFRAGLKAPLRWSQEQPCLGWSSARPEKRGSLFCDIIAPGTPFIWTSGAKLRCTGSRGDVLAEYEMFTDPGQLLSGKMPDEVRRPTSEHEVWQAGWPFPIP